MKCRVPRIESQTDQPKSMDTEPRPGGNRKGNTKDDYIEASKTCGSIREAAKKLNVSRATVREQWARYGIANPWTGEVPTHHV